MKENINYLKNNKIFIDISLSDKNKAVVYLNDIAIFEDVFIHYLKDSIDNKIYRYKSLTEHENFIQEIKRNILNERKTFTVSYSKEIIAIFYPTIKKEEL